METGDESSPIGLRLWTDADLPLLQEINTPEMTEHLGGPGTEQQVRDRHQRYLDMTTRGTARMFVVETGPRAVPVGSIGYWEKRWNDEDIYETGWNVLPAYQGQGLATAAARLIIEHARRQKRIHYLHAFPGVDNGPSNTICRKTGFELLGPCDFEFPPGRLMRSNDWRFDLMGGKAPSSYTRSA